MTKLLTKEEMIEFKEWVKTHKELPPEENSYINYFIKQKFKSNLSYAFSRSGIFVISGQRPLDKTVFGYKMLKKGGVLFTSPNFSIDLLNMQTQNIDNILIKHIYDYNALKDILDATLNIKNKTIVVDTITTILRFFKVDKLKQYPAILEDIRDASVKNNNKVLLITDDYVNFETMQTSTMSDKLLNYLANYKLEVKRKGQNIAISCKYPIEFTEIMNRI